MGGLRSREVRHFHQYVIVPVVVPPPLHLCSIVLPDVGRRRAYEDKVEDARQRKRSKKRELKDFYRFQKRQVQRREIADMRKVRGADKERVTRLRKQRKFRPF